MTSEAPFQVCKNLTDTYIWSTWAKRTFFFFNRHGMKSGYTVTPPSDSITAPSARSSQRTDCPQPWISWRRLCLGPSLPAELGQETETCPQSRVLLHSTPRGLSRSQGPRFSPGFSCGRRGHGCHVYISSLDLALKPRPRCAMGPPVQAVTCSSGRHCCSPEHWLCTCRRVGSTKPQLCRFGLLLYLQCLE